MKVIGFAGLARGGKTTAANFLCDWCLDHGMIPFRMSFADPMKKAAKRIGLTKEGNPELYRKTLQRWGESRRNPFTRPGVTGPDYWADRACAGLLDLAERERIAYDKLTKLASENCFREFVAVFDDVRYENELDMITEFGGTAVFVDGAPRLKDLKAEWRKHESEKMAMEYTKGKMPDSTFDYLITNYHDEETLNALVQQLAPIWVDMEVFF